ncbi:hypothetical protein [Pseudonocardia sp. N23]|uniref:hypothetical protein n=1 Tax=Pseudonocardia sp. N23 TaxID=1987376 RepID=UPI001145EFF6|nr:hypothetical protein [Pseudonocardia sp. N23]
MDKQRSSGWLRPLLALLAGLVVAGACSIVFCCGLSSSEAAGPYRPTSNDAHLPTAPVHDDIRMVVVSEQSVGVIAAATAQQAAEAGHAVLTRGQRVDSWCSHGSHGEIAILVAVLLLSLTAVRRLFLAFAPDMDVDLRSRRQVSRRSLLMSARLAQLCLLRT